MLGVCSRVYGLIPPCLTSQLFLVSHITLDEQCLLRFELLIQGSFTFHTCLKIPIHQCYLQTRKRGNGSCMKETHRHQATDTQAMDKQDAPFLDLRMCSSKFGFSASGVGGRLASLGLGTPGAPAACVWTRRSPYLGAMEQQSLGEGFAYALRRAGHQSHFAVHVHGGSRLCGWWASSVPGRRCSFYGPLGARVQRPWELSCQWAEMKLSSQRLGNRHCVTCP